MHIFLATFIEFFSENNSKLVYKFKKKVFYPVVKLKILLYTNNNDSKGAMS